MRGEICQQNHANQSLGLVDAAVAGDAGGDDEELVAASRIKRRLFLERLQQNCAFNTHLFHLPGRTLNLGTLAGGNHSSIGSHAVLFGRRRLDLERHGFFGVAVLQIEHGLDDALAEWALEGQLCRGFDFERHVLGVCVRLMKSPSRFFDDLLIFCVLFG
jgi:hypothetical protein